MAVNLSPYGGVGAQFLDNSGNVLTGGKIYTYSAGTTTPQATYTTSAGNIPHSNPIILDAAGRVPSGGEIWLTDGLVYKFILRDANDVLIATYDNISGINSNFVAFTNQQEIQTATAGQTIFNLTTMTYQPGTNSLSVFVDGVNQYGPGAQYAYLETDSDTVTFVNGLHVGAEVKFTTSQLNSSGLQSNAFQVSYTPPFTGSVGTNVGAKLAQNVSLKDFGAIGDGIVNDSAAINNALNSGALIIDGSGYSYKIDSSITIPADTTLQNLKLIAGTAGMNMVLVNDKSSLINAILVGTGTTSITERGVYPATDGASDVNLLNIDVSNLTVGIQSQPLAVTTGERWTITGYIHNIVGTTGASEGYGVLLSPANNCSISAKFKTIKRHAVYLSAGASYNSVDVSVDGCQNFAVQIFATAVQPECKLNTIRGQFKNLTQNAVNQGGAVGIIQNANQNDVSVQMNGEGNTSNAIWVEGSNTGVGPYPNGNNIHDCEITGSYLSNAITVNYCDSTIVQNNRIYATWGTAAIQMSGSAVNTMISGGTVQNNSINGLGTGFRGITNAYECPIYIGPNDIRNITSNRVIDFSTAQKRTGRSRSFFGFAKVTSISAGTSKDLTITLPDAIANAIPMATVNGGTVSSSGVALTAQVGTPSGATPSTFVLRAYNGAVVLQDIDIFWAVYGD